MYAPHIWKKKKKKKPEGEESAEKDKSEKEGGTNDKSVGEEKPDGDGLVIMETDTVPEPKQEEVEEYEDYCPFKLDMGYTPKPEEIAQDETVSQEKRFFVFELWHEQYICT